MQEEWRDISGYAGAYQVSNQGRVRSLDRFVTYKNRWGTETTYFKKGCNLSPGVNTGGYLMVGLFPRGAGSASVMVHTIVAESFIGPRPDGCDIHHKDGCKHNNQADNLEYKREFAHTSDHSLGNIPGNAKLTMEDARTIRNLIVMGATSQAAIAREYGVTPATITMIKQRKRWDR